jgi:hypothetical protein
MRLHLPLLLVGLALGLGSGCGLVSSKSDAGGTGGSGTGGSVGQGGGGGQAGGGCTACRSGAAAACPAGVSAGALCSGTLQTCCAGDVEFQCGCNTMTCAWSPICGDTGGTGGAGSGGATGTGGAAAGNGGHAGRSGGGGAGGSGGQGGAVGGSGGTGTCVCPTLSDPVCGVDGKTYGNPCEASCAGVAVAYQGSCPDGGADGGPPLRYCDTASDCVFRVMGCCGGSCAARTDPVSPPGIICNILCAEPACACVNHQCSTAARDGGAAGSGGGTGGNAGGSAGSGGPDGDAGCAGENENCTNGPGGRACCGGLLCCSPLPSEPPISLGSYCGYACPA